MAPPAATVSTRTPKLQDMAVVKLTVTGFRDIFSPTSKKQNRLTGYQMELVPDTAGKVRRDNDTIFVKRPGAMIRFEIASSQKEETYYPVGIMFLRKTPRPTNVSERLGLNNFDRLPSPNAQSLIINDHFSPSGVGDRYKFSIIIQRGSDGTLGIIDPGIEHER
jgi:hypothetical protein